MAKTNAGLRIRSTRNPFKGMSMADMKKKWSSMSPEQRAANVQTFRDAAKSAPKSKPKAAKPKASSSAGKKRFFAGAKGGKYDKAVQNKEKAKSNFFRSSSGTRGSNLPSNPKLKSQDTSRLTGRQKIALEGSAFFQFLGEQYGPRPQY